MIFKCRDGVIKKSNNYVFGNPDSSEPIIGYKVLKKYSSLCEAKNPDALTLFIMSENDIEQLASFMGHTLGVHRSSYRLPDSIYQTAKMSKLLVLMEKGKAGQFKGKSLDDIDLNDDLMDTNRTDLSQEHLLDNSDEQMIDEQNTEVEENETISKREASSKKATLKKRVLTPWTEQQKSDHCFLQKSQKEMQPPKCGECEELISQNKKLSENKNWQSGLARILFENPLDLEIEKEENENQLKTVDTSERSERNVDNQVENADYDGSDLEEVNLKLPENKEKDVELHHPSLDCEDIFFKRHDPNQLKLFFHY
ncbi:hypothetical protein FQR65_LT15994 [Abscondita terminalis]|nr:hypothetical protein FQR65_LT15994 [Abscondita terminalis]